MPLYLLIYLLLSAAAILQALLLLLQAWEHRRYGRSCLRSLDRSRASGRAIVLAPCKGCDLGLEESLTALMHQDYDDYEVAFIVESADDPATAILRRVMAAHPQRAARLVVAGRATDSGQKVHNLRAATANLSPEIQYLAFIDSDARPRREWLRTALARLAEGNFAATTGYRWFIPQRPSWANYLLYSSNCRVMSLLGKRSHYLVWGGSWAIRRVAFDAVGLHDAWQGTLSDDLMATRVLRQAQQPVRFEPACVVASPMDYSFAAMFSFARRQYLITRCYTPGWWLMALFFAAFRNGVWLWTAAALVAGGVQGSLGTWPAVVGTSLYLLAAFRGWVIQDLAKTYFPEKLGVLRGARAFDVLLSPLADLVHGMAIFSSAVGRHIQWRGIRYRLALGGGVTIEGRELGPVTFASPARAEEKRQREAA